MVCLLILLILFFAEQKFLILMKSSLSIISLVNCVFGVVSTKASANPRSCRFSPMLSPRSFIVLHFIFRLVIHFEFILMKNVRSVSRVTVLQVDV